MLFLLFLLVMQQWNHTFLYSPDGPTTTTILLDGKPVTLHLWDTSGQGRFSTVLRNQARGAHGLLIMYDITNKWSFDGVKRWLKEVDEHAPGLPKVLIGNRLHLEFNRTVHSREALTFAKKHKMEHYEVKQVNCRVEYPFLLFMLSLVMSLQDLCCRVIIRNVKSVHILDRLPIPINLQDQSLSTACDRHCYNGVCLNGTCVCSKGWVGSQCDHCYGRINDLAMNLNGFNITYEFDKCPYNCYAHGVCKNQRCNCDKNYTGDYCDMQICTDEDNGQPGPCQPGKCEKRKCSCPAQLHGEFCQSPKSTSVWDRIPMTNSIAGRASHASVMIDDTIWTIAEGNFRPKPTYDHTVVRYKTKLYMFGGVSNRQNITNELWSFDMQLRIWNPEVSNNKDLMRQVTGVLEIQRIRYMDDLGILQYNMNSTMGFLTMTKSHVLIFRGMMNLPPSGVQLFLHTATIMNGLMIVVGGNGYNVSQLRSKQECFSSMVQAYDIACKQWFNISTSGGQWRRYGHTAVATKNELFILGGFNGRMLNDIWRFTPAKCSSAGRPEECRSLIDGVKCVFAHGACVNFDPFVSYKPSFLSFIKNESPKTMLECRNTSLRLALQVCEEQTECVSCTSESGCGWCSSGDQCLPNDGECVDGQVCFIQLTLLRKEQHDREMDRVATSNLPLRLTMASSSLSSGQNLSQCPLPCAKHYNCEDCLQQTRCMWCPSTSSVTDILFVLHRMCAEFVRIIQLVSTVRCAHPAIMEIRETAIAVQVNIFLMLIFQTSFFNKYFTVKSVKSVIRNTMGHHETEPHAFVSRSNLNTFLVCFVKYISNHINFSDELSVDFIFTFKLKNEERDKHANEIYLFSMPHKKDTDVTFQISCDGASHALVALNLTSSLFEGRLNTPKRMMLNTTCDSKGFRRVYVASDPTFAFGTDANTTFFIFYRCFIVLLVVAGLLWMIKLRIEVYRRNQRRIDEIEHVSFAICSVSGSAQGPTPLSVEPCSNYKCGVFTLAVRLPTGGRATTPNGTSGLAVASALCLLTPAQLGVLQAPDNSENKNNRKTNLRRYIPFLRRRETDSS
uniref:SOCS box domain-containing protein n=1 Tax=Heterorhabditis bacteriophora TaxID=37862 RepID=A0A1I7WLI1_HETBA